jgi:hypothetical protein
VIWPQAISPGTVASVKEVAKDWISSVSDPQQRRGSRQDQYAGRPIAKRLHHRSAAKAEIVGGHAQAVGSVPGRQRHRAEQDQLADRIVRERRHLLVRQGQDAERHQQPGDQDQHRNDQRRDQSAGGERQPQDGFVLTLRWTFPARRASVGSICSAERAGHL